MEKSVQRAKFPAPVDRAAVAADWAVRGFDCHLFVDPPGQEWNGFVHDCNELVTVQQGEVELEVEGVLHRLSPGDEAVIPAGAFHSVRNRSAGESRWLFGYD